MSREQGLVALNIYVTYCLLPFLCVLCGTTELGKILKGASSLQVCINHSKSMKPFTQMVSSSSSVFITVVWQLFLSFLYTLFNKFMLRQKGQMICPSVICQSILLTFFWNQSQKLPKVMLGPALTSSRAMAFLRSCRSPFYLPNNFQRRSVYDSTYACMSQKNKMKLLLKILRGIVARGGYRLKIHHETLQEISHFKKGW